MGMTLTLMKTIDPKLFDGVGTYPEMVCYTAFTKRFLDTTVRPYSISAQNIFDYIDSVAGDLRTIYHSPIEFKYHFKLWLKANWTRWHMMYETLCYDYDPISNYDRTEMWTDETEQNAQVNGNSTSQQTGKQTANNKVERTEKVSAFDSIAATNRGINSENGDNTSNSTINASGTNKHTSNSKQTNTKTGRAYGNIGVTTTQEMIDAERRALQFNLLDAIVEEYKTRFCILIY